MRFLNQDGGDDTLELGPNLSLANFTFERSGNDLLLTYNGNQYNIITLKDQFLASTRIEWMQFTDGLTASLTHPFLPDGAGHASGAGEANPVVGRTAERRV